jgi:hypothetical protein
MWHSVPCGGHARQDCALASSLRQLSPVPDKQLRKRLGAMCQKEKSDGGSLAGACSVLFAASKWLSGRGSSKVLTLGKLGFRSAQLAGER